MPLGAGQLVDRVMATQRVLALIYALGTGLLVVLASGWVDSAGGLFAVFLVYWAVTAPAYSLCNSLAMRNLDDPGRDFGRVRSWGTAGWMVAGWVVSLVMAASGSTRAGQGAYEALWVAAAFSAAASLYCLTLPHTPPLAVGPRGRGALRARPSSWSAGPDVAVVLLTSFGVYLTLPLVYQVIPGYLEALRPAPRLGHRGDDPGPDDRDRAAGRPALAAPPVRDQGDAGPGDRGLAGPVPQPGAAAPALGGRGRDPAARRRHRLLHRRRARSSSTAGRPAICEPAPRPCSWWPLPVLGSFLGNLLAGEVAAPDPSRVMFWCSCSLA